MEKYIITCVSPDLQVANVPYNVQKIKEYMTMGANGESKIVFFPRLCLCGVTCGDLFFQPLLIEKCLYGLKSLVEFSRGIATTFVVGLPLRLGKSLYDVAAILQNGKLLGLVPNVCLSNDDRRYFESCHEKKTLLLFDEKVPFSYDLTLDVAGKKIGFVLGNEKKTLRRVKDDLASAGAEVVLHLSSDTEGVDKPAQRRLFAKAMSQDGLCYLCANPAWGESTSTDVYSGHNLYAENGSLYAENQPFEDAFLSVDIRSVYEEIYQPILLKNPVSRTPFFPKDDSLQSYDLIENIQAHALAKRLAHTRAKTAVIGVSGGLDSTLALLVVNKAFDVLEKDKKEIVAITMPGFGTTGKTFQNSLALIEAIGATSRTIDIQKSVLQHFEDIGHDKEVLDTTYENAQARTRTLILMDVANATGGIVVGTGDLSEAALGWCTYNGDHMSMYSVNASLPKTLIRKVVEVEASRAEGALQETLMSVLNTEISPELLPPSKEGEIAQKTEELVGPYELLDFFLYHVIEGKKGPRETYALALQAFDDVYTDDQIKKWMRNFYWRFFSQQFKRSCAPDGANVGTISFAPVYWRMPSDACATIWLDEIEKL